MQRKRTLNFYCANVNIADSPFDQNKQANNQLVLLTEKATIILHAWNTWVAAHGPSQDLIPFMGIRVLTWISPV